MKTIKKSGELLWLLGLIFVALGVSICSKANLGISMIAAPAFVLYEALAPLWSGFSVGMIEYLIQGLLLIILFCLLKRIHLKFLFAFAVAIVYGYCLNFFLFLLKGVSFDALWLRWVMLILGDVCTALGVACFFKTYLPLQVYELFVAAVSSHFHLHLHKVKWCFDLSLLLISLSMAFCLFGDAGTFDWSSIVQNSFHSIGLGTLVTTAINSPIIAFMSKLLDRLFEPTACLPGLEKFFKEA